MRLAHAKRRDANEPEIVEALLAVGATVEYSDSIDLIVGFRGKNYLIEVKNPKGRNKIEPRQQELIEEWGGQYGIARNPTEALLIIGAIAT